LPHKHLKILTINRNYFITGGPEKYMFSLMESMPQHQFIPFSVDLEQNRATPYRKYFVTPPTGSGGVYFKDFKMSLGQKVAYAFNSIYHMEARRKLEKLIEDEQPDLALFLNAVYFSDSIVDACRSHNVPIIWRMSDFNKVCANYLLYRDGHVCNDCLEHGIVMALRNRCGGYQRSLGAALVKIAGMWLSRMRGLYNHVHYFITPSSFTRQKMIQGGFPPDKVVHIPTCVHVPDSRPNPPPRTPEILYVGRLSHEKGVETLLEAFMMLNSKTACLSIAGDDSNDYAQKLKAMFPDELGKRIHFLGFQSQEQVTELFQRAACFVVPSACYENQPNVVLEGMAHAVPAVVSDLGSLQEMVIDGKAGYLFQVGNARELAAKIDDLLQNPSKAYEMGLAAKEFVAVNHSLRSHLSALEVLFEKCAGRR
jgi:glycosyltransferase involved in cell wall biosynthesis